MRACVCVLIILPFYLPLRKQQKAARAGWSLRSGADSQPLPWAEGWGGGLFFFCVWGGGGAEERAARLFFGVSCKALSATVTARLREGGTPPAPPAGLGTGSALSPFPLLAPFGAAARAGRRPGRDPGQSRGVRGAAGLAPPSRPARPPWGVRRFVFTSRTSPRWLIRWLIRKR